MGEWGELFVKLSRDAEASRALRCAKPAPPERAPERAAPIISPVRWVAGAEASGEIPYEQPCLERRGLVERRGRLFLHFCVECGRWGAYGHGSIGASPGRWYCREHRPDE